MHTGHKYHDKDQSKKVKRSSLQSFIQRIKGEMKRRNETRRHSNLKSTLMDYICDVCACLDIPFKAATHDHHIETDLPIYLWSESVSGVASQEEASPRAR